MLPDDSVVHVIGRLNAPPNSTIVLDSFVCSVYPGDPSDDGYQDGIPSDLVPLVWVVGGVASKTAIVDASKSRQFDLAVSEYVRDSTKAYIVHIYLEGSSSRWTKTTDPSPSTAMYAIGRLKGRSPAGNLVIDASAITLNLGPSSLPSMSGTSTTSSKKRKFHAVAPTTIAPSTQPVPSAATIESVESQKGDDLVGEKTSDATLSPTLPVVESFNKRQKKNAA